MKDMFRSFRIFTARYTITVMLQTALIMLVIFTVAGGLSFIGVADDSFAAGFLHGFLPAFVMVMPISGSFMLNAIYSYNLPINPGYKYMHSIKDSGKKYVQAIMAGNLISLGIIFISVIMLSVLSMLLETLLSPIYGVVLGLFVMGMINLTGNIRNQWVRIFSIMPLFLVVGFLSGFNSAAEEDGEHLPEIVLWIGLAVAIVIFVVGIVYSLCTSEKKWRRDEK